MGLRSPTTIRASNHVPTSAFKPAPFGNLASPASLQRSGPGVKVALEGLPPRDSPHRCAPQGRHSDTGVPALAAYMRGGI
jgi:hypothetical protein